MIGCKTAVKQAMLSASVTALLEGFAVTERQIARLDEQLKGLTRRSPVC